MWRKCGHRNTRLSQISLRDQINSPNLKGGVGHQSYLKKMKQIYHQTIHFGSLSFRAANFSSDIAAPTPANAMFPFEMVGVER